MSEATLKRYGTRWAGWWVSDDANAWWMKPFVSVYHHESTDHSMHDTTILGLWRRSVRPSGTTTRWRFSVYLQRAW